jgi:ferredoxin-NADP reductase
MPETETDISTPKRLTWRVAEVAKIVNETPRVKSLLLDVPDWPGHRAGQHLDVRLTAEDGYQAQRSYSIASEPENARLMLTVELIEEGEVSPYLTSDVRPGDKFELRGPIGGYFVWTVAVGGPLFLLAGGSGIAPLMAMLRYRAAAKSRYSGAVALFIADIRGHYLSRGVGSDGRAQRRAYSRIHADASATARMDRGRPKDRPQHA